MRPTLLGVTAVAVVLALLAAPLGIPAQQTPKVYRIGVLSEAGPARWNSPLARALQEFGWIEGQNLRIEWRFAQGDVKRLPGLANELVRLRVDLIVAASNHAIAAAQQATTSIPIVMMMAGDPVGSGFVKSLARPGGNVTGTTIHTPEVAGKSLEILKDAFPAARDVSVILEPDWPGMPAYIRNADAAARALGLRLHYLEVRGPAGLELVLPRVRRERPDVLYVVPTGTVATQHQRIITFAMEEKLPTVWPGAPATFAQAGGLLTYGFNLDEVVRRTAAIVDKVLKGARAADVPVEQPSRFDLAINLKTARALGLTIPPSTLVRATQIIE